MGKSWIPGGRTNEIVMHLDLFTRELSQRPDVYGVSRADADEARRLVETLQQAIAVTDNPATRTPLTVKVKQESLDVARKYCTRLATFIRANPNVSDADRLQAGVPPAVIEKRRVPPPSTIPILTIRGIIPGGHQIELCDSSKPDRRGKPEDARGLELFVAYSSNNGGAGLGMDQIVQNAQPHGVLTRALATVIHPDERVGSMANYIGRWINGRGEVGPWSQPVRMMLVMPADKREAEAA